MTVGSMRQAARSALLRLLANGLLATAAAASLPAQATPQRLQVVGGLAGVNQFTRHEEPFWTKELARLTHGQFTAEVVPWDRAGVPAADMLRMMKSGVVPFGTVLASMAAAQDMVISAPDLAGLNPDMPSMRRNVKTFRPFLEKHLREHYGVELLAVYVYPGQSTFCNKPLGRLDDIAGRRVRVSSPSQSDLVEALGGVPVRTAFAEIVPNVKSGNIDCVMTGTMSGNTIGLHEVTTHLHTMTVNWGLSIFGASKGAWQALPLATRELLKRELARVEQAIWDDADRETGLGVACNMGAAECQGGRKGSMTVARATQGDEQRRKEIFSNTVLTRWLQRCGGTCQQAWSETLGPALGVQVKPR